MAKKEKGKIILGIETSADDTCAAIVEDGYKILSNIRSSQIATHKKYGGIVPEVASRKHIELIAPAVTEAIESAGINTSEIDAIAATYEPGLKPALLVGQRYAEGLSFGLKKPLIKVNHLHGHVYANFLQTFDHNDQENKIPKFPLITLLVSGGHTQLILSESAGSQKIIAETLDDAAGEAFDKVARMLDLGYPGGPAIERVSACGLDDAIAFPRPLIDSEDFDFSFSGLKTSVKVYIEKNSPTHADKRLEEQLVENFKADVAASFQEAVVDVLVVKTIRLADELKITNIAIAGGVASNKRLREKMVRECKDRKYKLFYPPIELCVDNAAMIAGVAYHHLEK